MAMQQAHSLCRRSFTLHGVRLLLYPSYLWSLANLKFRSILYTIALQDPREF